MYSQPAAPVFMRIKPILRLLLLSKSGIWLSIAPMGASPKGSPEILGFSDGKDSKGTL